jgi:hypothetical protein
MDLLINLHWLPNWSCKSKEKMKPHTYINEEEYEDPTMQKKYFKLHREGKYM